MRHRYIYPFLLIVIALSPTARSQQQQQPPPQAGANQGPPPLPTMDELREMYSGGDYSTAVQQIARVLRLRGDAAKPYDRDALQLLRGQTLLALDDPRAAKRAFEEAEKSAQPDIAMRAHGYISLINRSKLSAYTKRTGDRSTINIADPKLQPAAFSALLDDELPALESEAAAATKANNLNPSIALVPKLLDLAGVEYAAGGKYERIGPIGKQVGDHARGLINDELALQESRIAGIEKMANELIDTGGYRRGRGGAGGWWRSDVTRRGLVSDEREDLYQRIQYLQRIEETAKRGQSVAKAIEGEVAAWDAIVDRAAEVRIHAESVLEAEGVRTSNDTNR